MTTELTNEKLRDLLDEVEDYYIDHYPISEIVPNYKYWLDVVMEILKYAVKESLDDGELDNSFIEKGRELIYESIDMIYDKDYYDILFEMSLDEINDLLTEYEVKDIRMVISLWLERKVESIYIDVYKIFLERIEMNLEQ